MVTVKAGGKVFRGKIAIISLIVVTTDREKGFSTLKAMVSGMLIVP